MINNNFKKINNFKKLEDYKPVSRVENHKKFDFKLFGLILLFVLKDLKKSLAHQKLLIFVVLLLSGGLFFIKNFNGNITGFAVVDVNKMASDSAVLEIDGVSSPIPIELVKIDEDWYYNITTLDLDLSSGPHIVRIVDGENVVFEENVTIGRFISRFSPSSGFGVPTPISSCTSITSPSVSYILTQNLASSGGTCINITASYITLNLAGYSISGATSSNHAAINISSSQNVIIKNGLINNSNFGIYLENATIVTINNITFRNNNYSIYTETDAQGINITNCIAYNETSGSIFAQLGYFSNWNIINNTFYAINAIAVSILANSNTTGFLLRNNTFHDVKSAITLRNSISSLIIENTILNTSYSPDIFQGAIALTTPTASDWALHNQIINNTISYSLLWGISIQNANYTNITGNNITFGNNTGISLGYQSKAYNNLIDSNNINGMHSSSSASATSSPAISFGDATSTVNNITNNNIVSNNIIYNFSSGIYIIGDGNVVNDNTLYNLTGDAIGLRSGNNISIYNNVIYNRNLNTIQMGAIMASTSYVVQVNNTIVRNNTIYNSDTIAIGLAGYNITIANNTIYNISSSISGFTLIQIPSQNQNGTLTSNVVISGNSIWGINATNIIFISAPYSRITNNNIFNVTSNAGGGGEFVAIKSGPLSFSAGLVDLNHSIISYNNITTAANPISIKFRITNLTISNNNLYNGTTAIRLGNDTAPYIQDVNILNNYIYNFSSYGLFVESGVGINLTGNTIIAPNSSSIDVFMNNSNFTRFENNIFNGTLAVTATGSYNISRSALIVNLTGALRYCNLTVAYITGVQGIEITFTPIGSINQIITSSGLESTAWDVACLDISSAGFTNNATVFAPSALYDSCSNISVPCYAFVENIFNRTTGNRTNYVFNITANNTAINGTARWIDDNPNYPYIPYFNFSALANVPNYQVRFLNSYNSTFINNGFYNTSILYVPKAGSVVIVNYSNGFGSVVWNSLSNFTIGNELAIGKNLFIENNSIGLVDMSDMSNLNTSSEILFSGLFYSYSSIPKLLKNGARCDNNQALCNMSYNSNTGVLIANISSFSNYTTANPYVFFGTGTENDGTNKSRNWVYANASTLGASASLNGTYYFYNASALINTTFFSDFVYTINWTNLTDGNYSYLVNITDKSNNLYVGTSLRHIVLDTIAPVFTTALSCSPASVSKLNDKITCSCSASDTGTGIMTLSYTPNPSTAEAGTFSTICTATDYAGNTNTSSFSYIVGVAASDSGGGREVPPPRPIPSVVESAENGKVDFSNRGIVGNTSVIILPEATLRFEFEGSDGVQKPRLDISFDVNSIKKYPIVTLKFIPNYIYLVAGLCMAVLIILGMLIKEYKEELEEE